MKKNLAERLSTISFKKEEHIQVEITTEIAPTTMNTDMLVSSGIDEADSLHDANYADSVSMQSVDETNIFPNKLAPIVTDDGAKLALSSTRVTIADEPAAIISDNDSMMVTTNTVLSARDGEARPSYHHPRLEEEAPFVVQNPQLEQLHSWHQKDCIRLKEHSEVIRKWYLDLYNVAEAAVQNSPDSCKYAHLIRDVSFALSNEPETINCYYRMCPNPKDECQTLLALKPNTPICDTEVLEASEIASLPIQFQKLYTHHQILNATPHYAVEAELLKQAMCSLMFFYRMKDRMHMIEMPNITQDPRYEPLKRHRGFLKVWELIEDLCRLIVGELMGQQKHEYSNRPSFFKTHSIKLLEEANHLIKEETPMLNT